MADDEIIEEEQVVIDYEALDETTGFKRAELEIWNAFEKYLAQPEDDRPDVDAWVDEFAEEKKFDKKRVKYVATLGIYAGPRDEFNQRSGSGKAIYANGDVYEGDFHHGKKHGVGHYIYKKQGKSEVDGLIEKAYKAKPAAESDDAFAARIAKHLKVGESIVKAALEFGFFPCYHGEYQRGVRVGDGMMKAKDGSVYRGEWRDNKRHGQGILYYVNGDAYSGQWENGLKHGFGTYRFADGGEYRGEWVKGVFAEGQWVMRDGNYYEGLFDKKNRPSDANARMHFPQLGITMSGVFKKGKWAPLNELTVSEEKPADVGEWEA